MFTSRNAPTLNSSCFCLKYKTYYFYLTNILELQKNKKSRIPLSNESNTLLLGRPLRDGARQSRTARQRPVPWFLHRPAEKSGRTLAFRLHYRTGAGQEIRSGRPEQWGVERDGARTAGEGQFGNMDHRRICKSKDK